MTAASTTTFWQTTYTTQAPKLLGLCQRYVADKSKAQDLLHDAFVTAIGKQNTFMNKGSFEGWLRRITINTVLMHLRKEKHLDRKSTRLNSSHRNTSRMPSSA